MIKKSVKTLLICLLNVHLLTSVLCAHEIGDLLYRKGIVGEWQDLIGEEEVGHVGVYIGFYDHDSSQMVVEAMPCSVLPEGEPCGVRKVTWTTFIGGEAYYGHRTTNPQPNAEQRSQISRIALDTVGRTYQLFSKGPDSYDCVTFAEMTYETVGLNPTPDSFESGTGFPLTPKEQFDSTFPGATVKPIIVLWDVEKLNYVVPGGATSGKNLVAMVSDGDYGSGLRRVMVLKGDPISGTEILRDETHYEHSEGDFIDTAGIRYKKFSLPANLEEGNYFIRGFDRANSDNSVGFVVDKTPPGIKKAGIEDYIYGVQTAPIILGADSMELFLSDDVNMLCEGVAGTCDKISGIKTIKLLKDGVPYIAPTTFEVPVKEVLFKEDHLPEGDYSIEMLDAAGNKTSVPIIVSPVSLIVSTADSHVTIDRENGTFTGTMRIKLAQSSYGIVAVAMMDAGMRHVSSITFSGGNIPASLETDVEFRGNITDHYYRSNAYGIGFVDLAGRTIWAPLNLTFTRQQAYANSSSEGRTADFSTPVLDLVEEGEGMLPGAVMPLYAPTKEEVAAGTQWWWESRNGYYNVASYPPCLGGWQDCSTHRTLPYVEASRQDVGRVKVETLTWDKPDRSDAIPYTTVDRALFLGDRRFHTCGSQLGYEPESGIACYDSDKVPSGQVFPLKRYVQTTVTMQKLNPTETNIMGCAEWDTARQFCTAFYDYTPAVLAAGPGIYGLKLKLLDVKSDFGAMIPAGSNVKAMLPGGILSDFGLKTVFTPGILRFSRASVKNYPGYVNLSGNLAFRIRTEATFDHAKLTIPYDPAGLTPAQESAIQVYRITDDDEYVALGALVDTDSKKVTSGEMNQFGRIMVAAPRHVDPKTSSSAASAAGRPELEFTAEGVSVEQSVFDTSTPDGAALLASVAENGVLVGHVYKLGPEDLAFETPGALKMHFDAAYLEASGIKALAIYRANPDGTGLYRLTGAAVDPVNHEIAVEVYQPSGLYMLVGSAGAAARDRTPPAADISYGEPKYAKDGKLYISTLTQVTLSGSDVPAAGETSSGLAALRYLVDASPILESAVVYTGPFRLADGVRTVYYLASDNAGNNSAVSSVTVSVDGTAPETAMFAGGLRSAPGVPLYITIADAIALSGVDPAGSGAASGVETIYRLVDVSPEECYSAAPPAACDAAEYSGPFTLPIGTHTVYYSAIDNVGNMSPIKSALVYVRREDVTPPVSSATLSGIMGRNGWHTSAVGVSFSAVDDSTGVAGTYYSLDGGPFAPVPAPGTTQPPAGWAYGERLRITERGGSALSAYQTLLALDTAELVAAGKLRPDCADLRFYAEGAALSHWLEGGCGSAQTRVWLKVPELPAGGSVDVSMAYGNPSAASVSNGPAVFDFYDDFNDNSIDTLRWRTVPGACPMLERNGRLEFAACSTGATLNKPWMVPLRSMPIKYVMETDVYGMNYGGDNAQAQIIALRWDGNFIGPNNPANGYILATFTGGSPMGAAMLVELAAEYGARTVLTVDDVFQPAHWQKLGIADDALGLDLYVDGAKIARYATENRWGNLWALSGRDYPYPSSVYYDNFRLRKYAAG